MITMYGIANCDKVRAARHQLSQQGLDYHFHDYRVDGLERDQVQHWLEALGTDTLINRRSTTWRELSEAERSNINSASAVDLILKRPTLLKRPLLEIDGDLYVGMSDAAWAHALKT